MAHKRSFSITINLEGDDPSELPMAEDEVYDAITRTIEDFTAVAYVAHNDDAHEWEE